MLASYLINWGFWSWPHCSIETDSQCIRALSSNISALYCQVQTKEVENTRCSKLRKFSARLEYGFILPEITVFRGEEHPFFVISLFFRFDNFTNGHSDQASASSDQYLFTTHLKEIKHISKFILIKYKT